MHVQWLGEVKVATVDLMTVDLVADIDVVALTVGSKSWVKQQAQSKTVVPAPLQKGDIVKLLKPATVEEEDDGCRAKTIPAGTEEDMTKEFQRGMDLGFSVCQRRLMEEAGKAFVALDDTKAKILREAARHLTDPKEIPPKPMKGD